MKDTQQTKHMLLALALCAIGISSPAQEGNSPTPPIHEQPTSTGATQPWQQYLEDLSETEDFEGMTWETYEEELEELAEHPININTATTEDLQRLPFLSAEQIEEIEAYIYRYGAMKSLGELAMISNISWYQRQLLGYFVYAGEVKERHTPTLRQITHYGKHEVVGTMKIPFYERRGDADGSYLGSKYKHWLRYQFRYGDYVKAGFLGAKDAGEPFFAKGNGKGYDFYSFYLQIRKWGWLKNLTIGRYRLHEGMGLILNNDFSFGKLTTLSALGRNSNTIRVHSSRYAANYLQGAAATVTLNRQLELTAFVSYRTIDATLNNGGIQTILTTGLHRTEKEMEKKDNASTLLLGGNIGWRSGGWHIGTTTFYNSYSLPLSPKSNLLYKRYAAAGKHFWNASIDYGYVSNRLVIQGETATGTCGTIATVNAVSYCFSDRFSLLALQRYYPYQYFSLYANAFSEGSDTQDESGAYIGGCWTPGSKWNITTYTDFAYFAWPKYGTTGSTQSWDNLLNISFKANKNWTASMRLRYKDKQNTQTLRGRVYAAYSNEQWSSKTQWEMTQIGGSTTNTGWMASQLTGFRHRWLKVNGSLGYFHTDGYSSRIYVYEPTLLYGTSFASFYGEGIRYALSLRAEIGKHLLLAGKLATTNYFDRNRISSGKQEISQSSQTDLEIQLKWKW